MTDGDSGGVAVSTLGYIVIFSFVSSMFIFFTMILVGGFNNFILYDLLKISEGFVSAGLMPSFFGVTAEETASNFLLIVPYVDILWFGAFVSFIISGLVFSYNRARENYFTLFTMSVLGIIVITYVGGFFIQLTEWFRSEVLFAVFPTLSGSAPIFTWYLDNLGMINLILIVLNIVANFVDLDFSMFNRRKEGENIDEI